MILKCQETKVKVVPTLVKTKWACSEIEWWNSKMKTT